MMSGAIVANPIIVAEPMSTIPCAAEEPSLEAPTPFSPSKPSPVIVGSTSRPATPSSSLPTYAFPRPLSPSKSEALKPNPHPYSIRTTSTGVLSRSNSAASTNPYQYQYYVPQSPSSPSKKEFIGPQSNTSEAGNGIGDKAKRGVRHRYSRSLTSEGGPTPLPVPPALGHRSRTGSTSSLSSAGSPSPTEMDDKDVLVFVDLHGSTKNKRTRAETMPPSAAAAFVVSLADGAENEGNGSKIRGRTSRTLGTSGAGKVKGMVASFERSASRGGDDEDGDNAVFLGEASEGQYGTRRVYGRPRVRHRRESVASDASVSSSSSFDSVEDSMDDDKHVGTERALPPLPADQDAFNIGSTSFDSTPKRKQQENQKANKGQGNSTEEPSMEELLASTSWDPSISCPKTSGGTVSIETVRLRDTDPSASTNATVTAQYITTTNNPSVLTFPLPSRRGNGALGGLNPDDEPTVEELLAAFPLSSADPPSTLGVGASAWERDIGCTVKHVGENESFATPDRGRGRSGRLRSHREEKPKEKKRLDDVFGLAAAATVNVSTPAVSDDTPLELAPLPENLVIPPPEVHCPPSPTASERELRLEQEMAETREMVCALSARVAGVEAKIGELEVAAEELEVRGRRLADRTPGEDSLIPDATSKFGYGTAEPQSFSRRLVVSFSRSVLGIAHTFVRREGVRATLAGMLLASPPVSAPSATPAISSLSPSSAKSRSRDVSQNREAPLVMWYKKSWACYLLFLGLGACAFVLRAVVKRGLMLRGRKP